MTIINTSNLFGFSLISEEVKSVTSPKVGAPPEVISLDRLYRLIGMQFEYKIELQNTLTLLLTSSPIVADYDVAGNTPTIREDLVDTFIGCGPTMGFEAKRAAYGALELIAEAIANDDDVASGDASTLNSLLLNTTRFVGIDEGDHEDFHFMVATYNLLNGIINVLNDTTQYGAIATLSLDGAGTGFTTDGLVDTAEDVVFDVSSTAVSNPDGYEDAEVTAEIIAGVIDSLTLITSPGEGFAVGQVVELNISTTAVGQGDATQTTPATAIVTSITD